MNPTQSTLLSVLPSIAFIAGALPSAVYVAMVARASLNLDAFGARLRKLLDAGDADRARKLTLAAPHSPHAAAVRAAVETCLAGVAPGDMAASYRDAGDLSPERVLAPVRARYDAAFDEVARPVRRARLLAIPSALLLMASAALVIVDAWDHASPLWLAGLSATLCVLLAWAARTDYALARGRDRMFDRLRGCFDALVRDPRRAATAPTRVRVAFEVREPGRATREVGSNDDVIKIGTAPNAQVQLEVPGVARMHAVVEATDDEVTVIDLGGQPQTCVNGVAASKQVLADGDVLTIGDAELRVRVRPWR